MRQSTTRALDRTQKRIRIAGAALLVLLFGAVYTATRPPSRPEILIPMTLDVEGLDCPLWCPIQVDRAVAPLSGLFDLRVDVERGRVHALLDPERLSAAQVAAALADAGWQVDPPDRP
jgi:hypothetical protein